MRNCFWRYILILLLAVASLTGVVQGAEKATPAELAVPEVKYAHFRLENGLEIYVFEDYTVPLVEVNLWYKVGSLDEPRDLRGISHLLEHMMFLGTNVLQKNQVHSLIKQVGGSNNAETSYAYTRYYEKVPAGNLELAIALEADRMGNLKIDPAELKREKGVVNQERRRNEIDPGISSALERITPHHDIIGTIQTLGGITPEKLLEHYHRYYTPNNAILAVTGAVKSQDVLELSRKYFGAYPLQAVKRLEETPEDLMAQSATIEMDIAQPYMIMQYDLPAGNDPDMAAVTMVMGILEGRLSANLQWNKKIISDVDCNLFRLPKHTTAEIRFRPMNKDVLAEVEAGFDAELDALVKSGVKDDQLQNFKVYYLRDLIFTQRRVDSFSRSVIEGVLYYNDPEFYRQEIKSFNTVTNEDLMRVAQKYFVKGHRLVNYIVPFSSK